MKLKKFIGNTIKEAMANLKAEMGEDAIVITTRELRDHVEILAASSEEFQPDSKQEKEEKPVSNAEATRDRIEAQRAAMAQMQKANQAPASSSVAVESRPMETSALELENQAQMDISDSIKKRIEAATRPTTNMDPIGNASQFESQVKLLAEMQTMKKMIEDQTQMMTWRDSVHKNPVKSEIWELLKHSGFSPLFARKIVEKLDDSVDIERAKNWLNMVLLRNLPRAEKGKDLVSMGGTYALVGPTGVGKTTTTAKIAARSVIRYGRDSVGLITTDSYRIGAQDQLRIYGKILGVQVYTAQTYEDLKTLRQTLSRKKLILIDTVGMAQKDRRIGEQTKMLRDTDAHRILLLNAAAQSENLDEVATHYKTGGLAGSILSKLDESVRIGGALDIAIRHKLPIHYMATGQQVPEDLYLCNPEVLVKRALNSRASAAFDTNEQEREWMQTRSHKTA